MYSPSASDEPSLRWITSNCGLGIALEADEEEARVKLAELLDHPVGERVAARPRRSGRPSTVP